MLFFIIKQIILSLILIVAMHYIFIFFKDNLTHPQMKDLVNKPKTKYQQIYSSLNKKNEPIDNKNQMKNELQNYLKEISTNTANKDIKSAEDNNFFKSNYETL